MSNNNTSVQLTVKGMTCASCVVSVENALNELDGVEDFNINLATETASIEYIPEETSLQKITQAIEATGYTVAFDSVTVSIGGMTCAMCVKTLESALGSLDGVLDVSVNLGAENAVVKYNEDITSLSDIKQKINESGYTFLGVNTEQTEEAAQEERKKSLRKKIRRIIVGGLASVVLMVLMHIDLPENIPGHFLMLVIALPCFLYVGYPIFIAAFRALKNRSLNMDVMYSMGIGVAFISSLMATFGLLLSKEFIFYETAVMLATFLTVGRYLEELAKGSTSKSIRKLLSLQAKTATVVTDNGEEQIPLEELKPGDRIRVKPGEKIPVDGNVEQGESYVDESMITGEPIPSFKDSGEDVYSGTLNKNGTFVFKAEKVGEDTVLSQIIKLVEKAQGSKPPIQRVADTAVSYFIPAVLTVAVVAFVTWLLIPGSSFLFALEILIAILVVACPCALGLATPTAVTVGIGKGADLGIFIKTGEALEVSAKLTAVVFDKTGTLTKGEPEVVEISGEEEDLLCAAGSVEKSSEHPLGEAIVKKAEEAGIDLFGTEKFESFGGKGVSASVKGREVIIGKPGFLKERKIDIPKRAQEEIGSMQDRGMTAVCAAREGEFLGIMGISDRIKDNTHRTIEEFKKSGFNVGMITGDNDRTAQAIGGELGMDFIISEVLPADKAREVKKLQGQGEVVAFIGDGVNDAPALAQSDVGIALGSGADVAIESGEIVLVKEAIEDTVNAVDLSRKVMRRIKQNLFWAFAYNTSLIPVAAGLFYPLGGIKFKPELAGLAMALSSVTVVTLSLLLKRYKPVIEKERESEKRISHMPETDNTDQVKSHSTSERKEKTMEIDPICNMEVDPETTDLNTEYKGKTYYFCAPGCKKAFEENPEKYLSKDKEK